jgi:hypothetical protein
MTYVNDIGEWSRHVCRRGTCSWWGCKSTFGLGGHHIIPRGRQELKLLLENGVCLCTEHHGYVESIKGRPIYDRIMIALVGKKRYETLKGMERDYLESLTPEAEIEMPSSKLEF